MTAKRLAFVFALFAAAAVVGSDGGSKYETQSIFYGLALTASRSNDTSLCKVELTETLNAVDKRTRWAVKLLDASGVPQSGLYWGGTFWLGSKSQCLIYRSSKKIESIPERRTNYTNRIPPFPVAFYSAYLSHDSNIQKMVWWEGEDQVTLGLCLPYSCSTQEISRHLQEFLKSRTLIHQQIYNMNLRVEAVKKTDDDMSWIWSAKHSIFIITTSLLVSLTIAGSIYANYFHEEQIDDKKLKSSDENLNGECLNGKCDATHSNKADIANENGKRKSAGKIGEILLAFSVERNFNKLFDLKHEKDMLLPLNGLRTFLMGCIVYGHITIYGMDKYEGRHKIHYSDNDFGSQFFQNAPFVVDTFYCMSGFLMGYTFFKNPKNQIKVSSFNEVKKDYVAGIFKRFKRLTPVYMYMLIISHTIGESLYRTSPLWNREKLNEFCTKYWWTNLLYINNMYPGVAVTCMSWGYYLSNDMQFFIVTSALLYLSKYYFKTSAMIGFAMCLGSSIYTAYIVKVMDFRPYFHYVFETSDTFYSPPWMRISPYLLGVLAAYFYYHHNDKIPRSKNAVRLLWLMYLVFQGFPLFGLSTREVSISYSMFYLSTSRVIWSIGSLWLIISCLTDNAGKFGRIMSHDLWIPFARMTYCVYLINPTLIISMTSLRDKNTYFDENAVMLNGLGIVFLTFLYAFFMVILVENPINNLMDIMSGKEKKNIAEKDTKEIGTTQNGVKSNGTSLGTNSIVIKLKGTILNGNGSHVSGIKTKKED